MMGATLILKTIWGFLITNWKWVLISLLAGFIYIKGSSSWHKYKDAVAQKAAELRSLSLSLQSAKIERETAQAALAASQANQEMLKQLLAAAQLERKVIAAKAQAQLDKFADIEEASAGLDVATSEHSVWVAKLATEATNELFQELEDEINH